MRFLQVYFCSIFIASVGMAQDQPIIELREESRQIMRTRLCGVCHIPPGNRNALRIFNLDERNWSSTMSDRQLEQIKWRIKVKGDEIEEQRGDPTKHQFSQKEIELLARYVDAEIQYRNPFQALIGL